MKNQKDIPAIIKELNKEIENRLITEDKLSFYIEVLQKERLFHLLVTMFTAVFCILFLGIFLVTSNVSCSILFFIFLVLEAFYIAYYYKLENTAISWEVHLGELKYNIGKDKI